MRGIVWKILLVVCASFFVGGAIVDFWYRFVAVPLFGSVCSVELNDIAALIMLGVIVLWSFLSPHRMAGKLWVLIGLYTLLYLELRFMGDRTLHPLVPFHTQMLESLYYADIVPVAMVVYGLTSRRRRRREPHGRENDTASCYFEDSTDVDDLLGHGDMARVLSTVIREEYAHRNNAVGIAVTGEWGAGKSTFLEFLDQSLTDCIRIKFDPWTENSSDVTADLLDRIEEGVRREDMRTARLLRRYFDAVNVTNVTGWFNLTLLAIRRFFDTETPEGQKADMKEKLRELEKPVVVFVDDSDRLPDDQFLKTISIIRGVADLPNVIFIVAFDQQRANAKLKDYGGEDFMRKLFNVMHPLQPIDEKIIARELCRNISLIMCGGLDNNVMSAVNKTLCEINVRRYIPTLREMKRFCNVIEKDYAMIRGSETVNFIDIRQWVVVELIKYTDMLTYTMLRSNPDAYLTLETVFGLNSPCYMLKDGFATGRSESLALLEYLFHDDASGRDDTVLISNPSYFSLYFDGRFPDAYIPSAVEEEYSIEKDDVAFMMRVKADGIIDYIHEFWKERHNTNIESVVCEILTTYPATRLFGVLEAVTLEYVATKRMRKFSELGERDKYREYSRTVAAHPFISVLAWRVMEEFCVFDSHEGVNDDCILKTKHPLVHCAIFNHHIRNRDHDSRIASDGYLFDLLDRLVQEGNHQEVIRVVADCVSADLPEAFLDRYIDAHFLDCLPYLLMWMEDRDTGEKMIYADITAFEGVFLSYDGFTSAMARLRRKGTYDPALLREVRRLVDLTVSTGCKNGYVKAYSFPLLNRYVMEEQKVLSIDALESDSFRDGGDRLEYQ